MRLLLLAAFPLLVSCASQSLNPEAKTGPGKGIVYATMNNVKPAFYCTYHFRNGTAEKDFTVNRSTGDKRDTLMVMEMDPGTWKLDSIRLHAIVGDDTYDYPFAEMPKVSIQVDSGKMNYMAHVNISEDCIVKAVAMRGTPAKCKEYTIEFKDEKARADAEILKRYKFLVPDVAAGTALVGGMPPLVKNSFLKPVVMMKIRVNPTSKTPFSANPADPMTHTIEVVK